MNTTEILDKAKKLVSGDRHKKHGDKIVNHENIARLWSELSTKQNTAKHQSKSRRCSKPDDIAEK